MNSYSTLHTCFKLQLFLKAAQLTCPFCQVALMPQVLLRLILHIIAISRTPSYAYQVLRKGCSQT